ncbi:MAG: hypothetical protein ACSLE5_07620, partial [Porticoccaceae bacterium]
MKRIFIGIALILTLAVTSSLAHRQICLHDDAPRQAVRKYLEAMKAEDFETAYDYVSERMTDGKSAADWVATQRKLFELGAVEIGDIDVRPSRRRVDHLIFCANEATVPNVLNAKDRLNNQGSTEFEIYTLIKTGTRWQL